MSDDFEQATAKVNNGKRRMVSFPGYEGPVGFVVQASGLAHLAYPARGRGMDLGTIVTIDGESWRAIGREASGWVTGMALMTMERVPLAEGRAPQ